MPVGALRRPRRPHSRAPRPARHERRAGDVVPRQGADEAGARRGRHPDAAARVGEHRRRHLGGGRGDRLPAHRQADRGRRLGRHLPRRHRGGPRDRHHDDRARPARQRRGVRRGGGVHLRHRVRQRRDPLRERQLVHPPPAPAAKPRVDQPGHPRPLRQGAPAPRGRDRDGPRRHRGARLHPRLHAHGVVPQGRRRGRLRRDRRPAARGPGRSTS